MGLRLKDNLGKCHWEAKESRDSAFSTCGVEPVWRDRNATVEDLLEAVENRCETYTYFYCEEWQRVGRSIKLVKIKEYDLAEKENIDDT